MGALSEAAGLPLWAIQELRLDRPKNEAVRFTLLHLLGGRRPGVSSEVAPLVDIGGLYRKSGGHSRGDQSIPDLCACTGRLDKSSRSFSRSRGCRVCDRSCAAPSGLSSRKSKRLPEVIELCLVVVGGDVDAGSSRSSRGGIGKTRRPRAADLSTNTASGGHGRAVVWVATLQRGGGASRWCTILAITNLHYQRAKPSPLWSGPWPGIRMGRGLARIPRILCGKAPCGADPVLPRLARRVVAPHGRGRWWRERPPVFWRWCATGEEEVVHAKIHHLPSPFRGVAPSTEIPGGKASGPPFALTMDELSFRVTS